MAQQIAKYRIVERIAAGGMGELFRARATGPGGFERDVALKVIREDLAASPMFKAQFLEEGKIAARLGTAALEGRHEVGRRLTPPRRAVRRR